VYLQLGEELLPPSLSLSLSFSLSLSLYWFFAVSIYIVILRLRIFFIVVVLLPFRYLVADHLSRAITLDEFCLMLVSAFPDIYHHVFDYWNLLGTYWISPFAVTFTFCACACIWLFIGVTSNLCHHTHIRTVSESLVSVIWRSAIYFTSRAVISGL